MFYIVGIICGLVIYNSTLVDMSFPLAMFKKLLGETPTLDDLQELSPSVGRSLIHLMEYDQDDFADVFSLDFTVRVGAVPFSIHSLSEAALSRMCFICTAFHPPWKLE